MFLLRLIGRLRFNGFMWLGAGITGENVVSFNLLGLIL
jgi:hypothetical protein